ncbi:MAG: thiamine diphosphokinase [Gaiellaceae bacterium]
MSEEIVVVIAGGDAPHAEAVRAIPVGTPVVAADRGLDHARALGIDVTVAVGDFDSASPEAVAAAETEGVRVERHPTDKDATDLELALDAAMELDSARILVLAEGGGRLDHLLSALLLLASPRYARVELDAYLGRARAHVIRNQRTLAGEPGELVSLFALHGPAEGVRTDGLVYPLAGETLEPGSSRGVSNVFAASTARIAVDRGVLVAIRPGADE